MSARSVIIRSIVVSVFLTALPDAHAGTLSCLRNGTTPTATDTDGDGIPDANDRVPQDATSACMDVDNDGLNDLREHWFGSDYQLADSDADGLQDGREVSAGLSPTDAADAWIDSDQDGFLNAHEAWLGTDPYDARSKPPMPPDAETGRFLPVPSDPQPAVWAAWDGLTDLAADGSAAVFFQNSSLVDGLGRATGTWTSSGPVIDIEFDPNQIFARWLVNSSCSQNPTGQVEQVGYPIRMVAMRSTTDSGQQRWIAAREVRIETPECGLSETRFEPIAEANMARADELPQLSLSEGIWVTWCVNTGRMEKVPAGTFYACRIEVYSDGTGRNVDEGVPVAIGRSTDGAQVVRYGDGSVTRYYLIRDFGGTQLVAILHENVDGTSNFTTRVALRRTEFNWPGEVASRYQWEERGSVQPFGFEMRADGGINQFLHNAIAGDWQVSNYKASWALEGGQLILRRYITDTGRIADAATCATVPCVLYWQRTWTPEAQTGSRLIVTHRWEFYDPVDTNGDGLFDTSTLASVEQMLRSYHRVPPDLDLDGIVDSTDLDDDGDDLPDIWEVDYFNGDVQAGSLGFYMQTGALDPDGDGYTNREEYVNGTDPLMPDPAPPRFADVPLDHWAYAFIERLALSGITAGCGGGNFCPSSPVTRAQMAVFLERGMRGSTFVPSPAKGNVFTDVTTGAFAASFIEQLYLDGITAGCGANKYCPAGLVRRAEMAVFLLRAKHGAGYRPPAATGLFSDVPLSHWAVHWIEQLAREGITGGCGGGKYCPSAVVTRDQMAVFLVRTFGL